MDISKLTDEEVMQAFRRLYHSLEINPLPPRKKLRQEVMKEAKISETSVLNHADKRKKMIPNDGRVISAYRKILKRYDTEGKDA